MIMRKPQITRSGSYEIIDNMIKDLQEIKANGCLEYVIATCGNTFLKEARKDISKLKQEVYEHEIARDVAYGR